MDHDALLGKLAAIGVPDSIVAHLPELPNSVEGLMIYGSRARGDALPDSDLDLLALVPFQLPSISAGLVSVSFYTSDQLSSGISTLFGVHLKRDGKILHDAGGRLATALGQMGEVDTARVLARVKAMSELFSAPESDLPKYLLGLLREARYLLRSALYAQAIADGEACFSVREIAVRQGDPRLATLLSSRQKEEPNLNEYWDCLSRLRYIVGDFPNSRHGSLEATVVNEWGETSDLLSMAFMALGSSGGGSDYAEVEKILL